MALPIGMLEWEPAVTGAKRTRISAISTDGAADTAVQSNYNIIRWNAFDSIDLSGTVWQVTAFWNSALNMVMAVRNTEHGAWTQYVMDGGGGRPTIARSENDNHNTISLHLDSDGYIHTSYDQHNVALKYRKSTTPISSFAGVLGSESSMTGVAEASVAYPCFFRDPQGKLYFMHRSGVSGGGDLYLKVYDTGAGTWSAAGGTSSGKVINGLGSSPDQSPYWNGPLLFTSDFDGAGTGYAYLSWAWRETADTQTMHDMSVVRWNGVSTWTKTDGTSQTMPVTLANCEIVDAFGQNHSFASFNTQVLDSGNNLHIFYTGNDVADSENSKLWHAYKSGGSWTKAVVAGGAGYTFWLNGPCAVIDPDDTIRIVVCHVTNVGNGLGISAYISAGTNYASWSVESLTVESTMVAEGGTLTTSTNVAGQFDRYQWKQNGVFRMMVPITGYWKHTADDFSTWTGGYIQATADAPSGAVTNPTLRLVVDSTNTQWWAAVASDGKDVRVSDGSGQQLPMDLVEWDYTNKFALITFMYYGDLATAPTVRVYAGNASATAPAASDTFGQYAAYHPDCWGYWPSGGGNDRTSYANHFTMTGSPTATAATGVMGETTYDYNGSSQYGLTSTKVVNTAMTMMINARSTSNTLSQYCISNANGGTTGDYRGLQTRGSDAGDPVVATSRIGAGGTNDSTKVGYVVNTWCHIGGRFSSGSSSEALRTVYLDGVAGTPNTTSIGIPTATRIGIAVLARSALDAKFVGKLANAWLFAADIGADKVSYNAAQNNQPAFWNGWSWTAAGGGTFKSGWASRATTNVGAAF